MEGKKCKLKNFKEKKKIIVEYVDDKINFFFFPSCFKLTHHYEIFW